MIPDTDYEVSSLGQVRDSNTGESPETWVSRDGVLYVHISEREFGFRGPVWRLMLAAFFRGNVQDVGVIYRDGIPRNLSLDNLSWYIIDRKTGENREIGVRVSGNVRTLDRRLGRKVEVIEKGWVFSSVAECARHIDGDASDIYKCLKGSLATHRGFSFRYV